MIITIGRKPFVGTVVGTVKDTHCGAINVDASRIKFETDGSRKTTKRNKREGDRLWAEGQSGMKNENSLYADADPRGRFPANVVLSSSVTHHLPEATQGHWAKAKVTGYGSSIGQGTQEYFGVGEKDKEGGSVAKYFFIVKE